MRLTPRAKGEALADLERFKSVLVSLQYGQDGWSEFLERCVVISMIPDQLDDEYTLLDVDGLLWRLEHNRETGRVEKLSVDAAAFMRAASRIDRRRYAFARQLLKL